MGSERLVVRDIGGFTLVRELGQGGMGKVFLARQKSLDRLVALKVLQPALAQDEEFLARFHREARAAALFQHPNVAAAIDAGKDESCGVHYIAFEFIEGGSLEDRLKKKRTLPEEEALFIARGIALALAFAESKGVVHRDVKPDNILLALDGTPKLADLGLAKRACDEASNLTQTGIVMGTPLYMAPEQALGDGTLDIRADIYALGLCLWRMLTGLIPFDEDGASSSLAILTKHINEDLVDVRSRAPTVSEGTAFLIGGMSAREPRDRYQSATNLAKDIDRLLAGEDPLGPYEGNPDTLCLTPTEANDAKGSGEAKKPSSARQRPVSSRSALASAPPRPGRSKSLPLPVVGGVLLGALGIGIGMAVALSSGSAGQAPDPVAVVGTNADDPGDGPTTPPVPDPAQPDPAQPDPAQPDPAQPDPAQPDPVQPDPVQPDPVQPDPPLVTPPDPSASDLGRISPEVIEQRADYRRRAGSLFPTALGHVRGGVALYKELRSGFDPDAFDPREARSLDRFLNTARLAILTLVEEDLGVRKERNKALRERLDASQGLPADEAHRVERGFARRTALLLDFIERYRKLFQVGQGEREALIEGLFRNSDVELFGVQEVTGVHQSFGLKDLVERREALAKLLIANRSSYGGALMVIWNCAVIDAWAQIPPHLRSLTRRAFDQYTPIFAETAVGRAVSAELRDLTRVVRALEQDGDMPSVVGALVLARAQAHVQPSPYLAARVRRVALDDLSMAQAEGRGLVLVFRRRPPGRKKGCRVMFSSGGRVSVAGRTLVVGDETYSLDREDWFKETAVQIEPDGQHVRVRFWDLQAASHLNYREYRPEGQRDVGTDAEFEVEVVGDLGLEIYVVPRMGGKPRSVKRVAKRDDDADRSRRPKKRRRFLRDWRQNR